MQFTAVFERADGWWIGYVEQLPGANTQGRTLDEARENLKDAIQLLIQANQDLIRSGSCRMSTVPQHNDYRDLGIPPVKR